MEIKKTRNKRRLLLLILALAFTSALFTTSTYAWFTANQNVNIQQLRVNIQAQNGLQISADGTNWKSVVTTQDFQDVREEDGSYEGAHNQFPSALQPVSTIGELNDDNEMKMFYGTVVSDSTTGINYLTSTLQEDTSTDEGKYIAFDMFLKVDAGRTVWLTTDSGAKAYGSTDKGVKNAARMGFVVMGSADAGASLETVQNIGKNTGDVPVSKIWELNDNAHKLSAVGHARDVYGITITEGLDNDPVPYTGFKDEFSFDPEDPTTGVRLNTTSGIAYATTYEDYFEVVTPDYSTEEDFDEPVEFLTLETGITKIRVYMWIEGQDVDCENSASGEDITFDLYITTEN